MMKIVFSASISERHQQRLKEQYPNHLFVFGSQIDEIEEELSTAHVIVTYGEDLTEQHIEKAVSLEWIMVISAGIDKLPFEAIVKRDIIVTNSRGVHAVPMSEYAISMILNVNRQEAVLLRNTEAKNWDRSVKMKEISGSTLVVLGTGAIGQEVARLAKAFQMTTYGVARTAKQVEYFDDVVSIEEMHTVLPKADHVVAVLPSTSQTKNLLREEHFNAMKNDVVFLNMGRGDLVQSEVIINALDQGQIAHAVLDVFEVEPLPADHPLWKTKGVTITPHLSGISPHYHTRALEIFTDNLTQMDRGETELKNLIDLSRRY